MNIPRRDPDATPSQEAERLAGIAAGRRDPLSSTFGPWQDNGYHEWVHQHPDGSRWSHPAKSCALQELTSRGVTPGADQLSLREGAEQGPTAGRPEARLSTGLSTPPDEHAAEREGADLSTVSTPLRRLEET